MRPRRLVTCTSFKARRIEISLLTYLLTSSDMTCHRYVDSTATADITATCYHASVCTGRLLYTSLRHSQPMSFTASHSTSSDRTTLRYRLSTFSSRAFSVAGPTVWNLLPDSLRDPAFSSNSFRQSLMTNLFRRYHSAHTAQ